MSYKQARLRRVNAAKTAAGAEYVLYWMQAVRRLACARELGRPLGRGGAGSMRGIIASGA